MRPLSLFKGLAQARAYAHGELLRLEDQIAELQIRAAACQKALAAADVMIDRVSILKGLRPDPIRGWRGKYGSRGGLTKAVAALLSYAHPCPVASSEIGSSMAALFELQFSSPDACRDWKRHSVGTALRILDKRGLVIKSPPKAHNEGNLWLWSGPLK
jgi:hypothetical protein